MPCNAMHPIQYLFLEGFSYVLQIDMHFICSPMWTKFYSCKKWVLQNAAAIWYARLPPRSITSWAMLKEKFLVNFQDFYADTSTEEDFFSCQQYERETLTYFFSMFLRLKAQAPEVSDEQAITQDNKALHAAQLHNHLVRECPRTLEELYEEFRKFSRAEVLHFHKLGQQRKAANENKSSRPFKYSTSKEGTSSFDASHKQVHNIDSDGCGPPEREKNFRPPRQESKNRVYDSGRDRHPTRGGGRVRTQDRPLYCMFHERDTDHQTRNCPIFL
jgi:hypothetical protein